MNTTSATLLEKLRQPGATTAWSRFVDLYAPLFFFWSKKSGLSDSDANDVVQEVFLVLVHALPKYEYSTGKSFRNWLRVIVVNKARELFRRRRAQPWTEGEVTSASDASDDPAISFEEDDYQQFLLRRAFLLMKSDFQETTWKACWGYLAEGRPAAVVADELGISVNAVYLATSRVMRRLRQDLAGLIDLS